MMLHAHHLVVLRLRRTAIISSITTVIIVVIIVPATFLCIVLRTFVFMSAAIVLEASYYLIDIR